MIQGDCAGCMYAVEDFGDDGEFMKKCQRYPQSLFVVNGFVMQAFPDAIHRCGEYTQSLADQLAEMGQPSVLKPGEPTIDLLEHPENFFAKMRAKYWGMSSGKNG